MLAKTLRARERGLFHFPVVFCHPRIDFPNYFRAKKICSKDWVSVGRGQSLRLPRNVSLELGQEEKFGQRNSNEALHGINVSRIIIRRAYGFMYDERHSPANKSDTNYIYISCG